MIEGDYIFEAASDDTTFQHVTYRERNRGDITGLALLALIGVGGLILAVVLSERRDANSRNPS